MFDVHPDGERIVLSPAALAPNAMYRRDRATFILNFADELRRTVPQKH
jgi:hypothetical protein